MSGRDLLTQAMADAGLDNVRDDDADFVIEALTAAGYRIIGPDEIDPVTVEKCAEVAWNATISTRNHPHDAFRDEPIIHREIIAAAIRSLGEGR